MQSGKQRRTRLWLATGTVGLFTVAVAAGCASNASEDTIVTPPPASSAGGSATLDSDSPTEQAPSESQDSQPAPPSTPSSPAQSSEPAAPDGPMFVTSLPQTVKVAPFQPIIVQLPTDPETRWSANVNGTATVDRVTYSDPPGDQPGAPGISIVNVTAPNAGISYVNFVQTAKGGGATIDTARLEIVVKK